MIHKIRRSERAITNQDEINAIIKSEKFMTIAMCASNEPYLVTLNYGYDSIERCFYFHCAVEGKKLDILRQNPVVWGQIIQDRGYIVGDCSHAYSSVEFHGKVSLLNGVLEKKNALSFMIDRLEPDPERVKETFVINKDLGKVLAGRIDVDAFSGKKAH
nr:pyridoxamine 5'-phosphate oxidase family protein [Candidatus Sigynarchaeota archaeon]